MKIFCAIFLTFLSLKTFSQTRNVVIGSYEQDSIEKAEYDNKNFHSELKNFTSAQPAEAFLDKKGFQLSPLTQIAAGYQSEGEDNVVYDAFLGLSGGYNYKKMLSISANVIGGYSSPLNHRALLADSLGWFPQLGDFKKNDNNYFVKYFEFYINYRPADYLLFSFGKGKKQIGEGIRSALLSAQNSGMYYFDLRVDVRNFCYVFSINGGKNLDTKLKTNKTKWTVYHLFSWNAAKWLSFGGFEAVNLVRRDSLNNSRFVDLHYINPLIFTRPVEYSLGSPDNELMGVFGKLKFFKQTFYAQAVIDEFKIKEVKAGTGWWANKYALQAGVKGFVLNNFSYVLEANYIRPYMYSHDDANNSHSMFNQPYANPYGANLKEFLAQLKYFSKLFSVSLTLDYVEQGKDFDKYSYGGNVLRSYNTRRSEYDNFVGQGSNVKFMNLSVDLKYQPQFLKGLCLFSQAGSFDGNAFCMLGVKTSNIFFDNTL
ncbi:MAG: hypothetical protein II956_10360 [Bacteroidales bacterium]|nr:hypothetical protein [Bacteroidales bacterium]